MAARAVVAVAQPGFAIVSITPTNHSVSMQLQPWGRIEGALRLATQPNSGQQILLSAPPGPGQEETLSLSLGCLHGKNRRGGELRF